MDRLKRVARVFAFVCLIVLAGVGVGLSGGVPLPAIKNRKDSEKENIEIIDKEDEKSSSQQGQIKD